MILREVTRQEVTPSSLDRRKRGMSIKNQPSFIYFFIVFTFIVSEQFATYRIDGTCAENLHAVSYCPIKKRFYFIY